MDDFKRWKRVVGTNATGGWVGFNKIQDVVSKYKDLAFNKNPIPVIQEYLKKNALIYCHCLLVHMKNDTR
jgi:hypothetical protein